MKQVKGDIFNQVADAICIPTNGYVTKAGKAVMGAGIAKIAKEKFKDIDSALGKHLNKKGNIPTIIYETPKYKIVSFPVKPEFVKNNGENVISKAKDRFKLGDIVPGWAAKATYDLINESLCHLVKLTDDNKWEKVIIPFVGCGNGELDRKTVSSMLNILLDDRFILIDYEQ